MWMICSLLSTLAVLSTIQNVDTAPMMNKALKRGARGIDGSQGRNVFAPKYMMDLYNIIVDKNGNRRKGVSTTADKIKCFLPGKLHFKIYFADVFLAFNYLMHFSVVYSMYLLMYLHFRIGTRDIHS